mgnify:CR=1 FL=1
MRIKMIEGLREKSRFINKVGTDDFDPFEEKLTEVFKSAGEDDVNVISARINVMKKKRIEGENLLSAATSWASKARSSFKVH